MRFLTTLILALLLCGVAVLICLFEGGSEPEPEGVMPLFPGLVISDVDRIELSMYLGRRTVLERSEGNRWEIQEPFQDEVRREIIRNMLETIETNTCTLIPLEPSEWDLKGKGLDPPAHFLKIRDSRGTHTLFIGTRDPFRDETFVQMEGRDGLYRTGSNILNLLELNPENLRDDRIFRIDPLLVNEMWFEGPDGLIMETRKRTGIWEILAPARVESESGRIQTLVSRLSSLKVQNRMSPDLAEKVEGKGLALKEPAFRIVMRAGPFSKEAVIAERGWAPGGNHLCIRDGKDVVSVSAVDWERIPKKLNAFRSLELLKPVREDLQKITVWRGGELHFELQRMPEGDHFKITRPFQAWADNVKDGDRTPVYQFLVRVDGIRIQEFVADGVEDLEAYGLDPPALTVELLWREPGSMQKTRLLFSAEQASGTAYAARRDRSGPVSVFEVEQEALAPLYQDPLLIRDRRIFPWQEEEIAAIRKAVFSLGNRAYTIEREEKGFFEDDPENRFQQFLHTLGQTQVVRFLAEPIQEIDPRFEDRAGSIHLTSVTEEGKTVETFFELGAPCNEGRYGRISTISRGICILDEGFFSAFEALFRDL